MTVEETAALFEALADPSRLRILSLISDRWMCGEDLSECLGLSPSTVSCHVKKLEGVGLVRRERRQYYWLFQGCLERLDGSLRSFLKSMAKENPTPHPSRPKIQISAFFEEGRLLRLPAPMKKRRIILRAIAEKFSFGRKYSEREVNDILKGVYPDYCTLRRDLIDHGFMDRREGEYWRSRVGLPEGEAEILSRISQEKGPTQTGKKSGRGTAMATRAELKRAYKEAHIPAGVFQIRNLENGKVFLAGSLNLPAAFNSHSFQLSFGSHKNEALQKDWTATGAEGFAFEVLEEIPRPADGSKVTADDVRNLVKRLLTKMKPWGERGYNEPPKGSNPSPG